MLIKFALLRKWKEQKDQIDQSYESEDHLMSFITDYCYEEGKSSSDKVPFQKKTQHRNVKNDYNIMYSENENLLNHKMFFYNYI